MNELRELSAEKLMELQGKLGEVLDILNPTGMSFTELMQANKEHTLNIELIGVAVFRETQRKLLKTK